MPIDRVTLIVSDTGFPAPHASSHAAGGEDEIAVSASQITGLGTLSALNVPTGPFSNDAAAAAGGVAVGSLYYKSSGQVQVRLT